MARDFRCQDSILRQVRCSSEWLAITGKLLAATTGARRFERRERGRRRVCDARRDVHHVGDAGLGLQSQDREGRRRPRNSQINVAVAFQSRYLGG